MTEKKIDLSSIDSEKQKFPESNIMVIFGASGDLTKRMLVPSMFRLYCEKLLPRSFSLFGFSRKEMNDESFRKSMKQAIVDFGEGDILPESDWEKFEKDIYYMTGAYDDPDSYEKLKDQLDKLDEKNIKGNILFYMAVPPDTLPVILENLGKAA